MSCAFCHLHRNCFNANNFAERYEKFPFDSLLSFIHIVYVHLPLAVMGLDIGLNKGARDILSDFIWY